MDSELVGIIAASSVCGFFGIIIAIIIGCYCGRRIEKKKEEEKKAQTKEWVNGVSPLSASESGFSVGPHHKLATYQPKILGKSISQEQLIRESSANKGSKSRSEGFSQETRRVRRFSSSSDIRSEEIGGKSVSVVEVRNHEEDVSGAQYVYGHHSYHNGGFVVPGYMVGDHIYPEVPSQRKIRQGQIVMGHHVPRDQSAVLVRGHHVTASGGQVVQGHRVVESDDVSRQHVTAQNTTTAVIAIKQETPQLVQGHRSLHTTATAAEATTATQQQTLVTETIQQSQSSGQLVVEETPVSLGYVTTVRRFVEEDPQPSSSVVTTVVEETSVSPITTTTVVSEERTLTTVPSVLVEERLDSVVTRQEEETGVVSAPQYVSTAAVAGQRSEVSVQVTEEHHSEGEKFKVIRRHHEEHAKLPTWMTVEGEENQVRTMEFDEEDRVQVDAAETSDVGNFGAVSVVNTGSVVENPGIASVIVNNANTGPPEDYIIMDYVDPEQPNRASVRQATAFFEQQNLSTSGEASDQNTSGRIYTTTTTTTSEVIKSTRQMVNESADQVPPASTSTPRVPVMSEEETVTTFVVGAQGRMVEQVESHRQRTMHDGSVEFLPPPPPPPPDSDLPF